MDFIERLFSLPNEIIVDILSRLDNRERVRCCLMAKDHKKFWVSVPITLEFSNVSASNTDTFKFFANMFQQLHYWGQGRISQLNLILKNFDPEMATQLDFIAWYTSTVKIENFSLRFLETNYSDDAYPFAQILFSNDYLTSFEAVNCRLNPMGRVKWLCLKCLSIGLVTISPTAMDRLLKGAPNLHSLTLDRINGLVELSIESRKLLKLVLVCYEDDEYTMRLSAPHLEHLELRGNAYYNTPWILMELGSLISGILDFQADFVDIDDPLPKLQAESDCLIQIFRRFSGVESLELGYWAMQCLSMMGFGDFRSSTLKILRFTASTRTPSHHPTLDFISRRCTSLETLCINWNTKQPYFFQNQPYVQAYSLPQLTRIEMKDLFTGSIISNNMIELLMGMLRNATCLDRLVITDAILLGDTNPSSQGRRVILPASFTGGARYMLQNYQDAMAICKWTGYPDLFITFTCNPKWPEITRFVESRGLNPEDRPDILSRVFKIKLNHLIKDLKDNQIF